MYLVFKYFGMYTGTITSLWCRLCFKYGKYIVNSRIHLVLILTHTYIEYNFFLVYVYMYNLLMCVWLLLLVLGYEWREQCGELLFAAVQLWCILPPMKLGHVGFLVFQPSSYFWTFRVEWGNIVLLCCLKVLVIHLCLVCIGSQDCVAWCYYCSVILKGDVFEWVPGMWKVIRDYTLVGGCLRVYQFPPQCTPG